MIFCIGLLECVNDLLQHPRLSDDALYNVHLFAATEFENVAIDAWERYKDNYWQRLDEAEVKYLLSQIRITQPKLLDRMIPELFQIKYGGLPEGFWFSFDEFKSYLERTGLNAYCNDPVPVVDELRAKVGTLDALEQITLREAFKGILQSVLASPIQVIGHILESEDLKGWGFDFGTIDPPEIPKLRYEWMHYFLADCDHKKSRVICIDWDDREETIAIEILIEHIHQYLSDPTAILPVINNACMG